MYIPFIVFKILRKLYERNLLKNLPIRVKFYVLYVDLYLSKGFPIYNVK